MRGLHRRFLDVPAESVRGAAGRRVIRERVMRSWKVLVVIAIGFLGCAGAPGPAAAPPPAAESVPSTTPAASSAPTAPAAPSAPATPGDVLESNRSAFDACYAQARALNPTLGRTRVEMTFTLGADGKPVTVDLQYRNRMEDRAKECMRDAALSLQFPPSMHGSQTATLVFTPPGP